MMSGFPNAVFGASLWLTTMQAQSYPTRDAVAVLSDGEIAGLYVAGTDVRTRELLSYQFYEPRPDLGEVDFLKRVNWEVRVPSGGQIFIPSSGLLQGKLNAFWLGWRETDGISALSIFQETPIRAGTSGADRLIAQPLIMPNKKLYYYLWRGPKLCRLEFSGEFGQPGRVDLVDVGTEEVVPVLSATHAVPGSTADDTVVGLVDIRDAALRVGVLLVSGKKITRIASDFIDGYTPVMRQQLGVHVDPEGAVTIAFVAERRDKKGYAVIEVSCQRGTNTCHVAKTEVPQLSPESLYSAAAIYYGRIRPRNLFTLILQNDGKLSEVGADGLRLIRTGVDRSYSFPILSTIESRYEATLNGDGSVKLHPIH